MDIGLILPCMHCVWHICGLLKCFCRTLHARSQLDVFLSSLLPPLLSPPLPYSPSPSSLLLPLSYPLFSTPLLSFPHLPSPLLLSSLSSFPLSLSSSLSLSLSL